MDGTIGSTRTAPFLRHQKSIVFKEEGGSWGGVGGMPECLEGKFLQLLCQRGGGVGGGGQSSGREEGEGVGRKDRDGSPA